MNRLHPKKLLNSKWTAVQPEKREKHFRVSEVEFDDDGNVVHCLLEAVLTGRERAIDWRELKDASRWRPGWS
ncbi:TIGR02450 family Trp-rich protein [Halomonas denitrificans]|nr:TIGR02450 family Trp-rich protein [Halomonas denitrificans]